MVVYISTGWAQGGTGLAKMCMLVQWEKWGSNTESERKERVKSR